LSSHVIFEFLLPLAIKAMFFLCQLRKNEKHGLHLLMIFFPCSEAWRQTGSCPCRPWIEPGSE